MEVIREYIANKQANLLGQQLQKTPKILNKQDDDGRTPLMWALSESQDPEIVSVVLKIARESNILDIDLADNAGFTALHVAAALGAGFVSQLLPFKPDIDSRTNNRQTPLFFAVSKQHIDAAKLLIENGASAKSKDSRQVTILQRASALGSVELVELLLAAGAPVNATDAYGWTALHYAYAEDHGDVARLLEEHGANTSLETNDGELPKDLAPKKY